jgi:hypothetical protein
MKRIYLVSLLALFLSACRSTLIPKEITYTPTITSINGYTIWIEGSDQGYLLQYPIDLWRENQEGTLNHKLLEGCKFMEISSSEYSKICVSNNCSYSKFLFGGIPFIRMISKFTFYWTVNGDLGYFLQVYENEWKCRTDAEEVLNSISKVEE